MSSKQNKKVSRRQEKANRKAEFNKKNNVKNGLVNVKDGGGGSNTEALYYRRQALLNMSDTAYAELLQKELDAKGAEKLAAGDRISHAIELGKVKQRIAESIRYRAKGW